MVKSAEAVVEWLIRYKAIEESDRELYTYAVYNILLSILPLLMAIMLGGVMGCIRQCIVLIIPFMFIRKFSGGYHMNNPWSCLLCSCISLIMCAEVAVRVSCTWKLMVLTVIAGCSLMIFSPIDSENRRLEPQEKNFCQRIVWGLAVAFISIMFILQYFGAERIAVCISVGVLLTAGLQLPCLLKRLKNNQKW